jgi:glycosyltransferase involved in cell wall biosynthesis
VRQDVRFFGFVPHRTLAALYRMASVFAFPSLYEGFGLPPLEAMACGTPVVTSRISALPEVVGDGALLVDPYSEEAIAEGIARVLDDGSCSGAARAARPCSGRHVQLGALRAVHPRRLHEGARPARARPAGGRELKVRPRPRLAHRDAGGREGAPLARPPVPRRPHLHPPPRPKGRSPPSSRPATSAPRSCSGCPAVATRYRHYLPLFPAAAESLDLRGFDLVLSSSHCVAKGVRPPPGARHLCYCHTPMRYVWDRYDDYFGPGRAPLAARLLIRPVAARLRAWDARTASRVHRFAANSRYVAGRIRRYYGRESVVIPPPVDTDFFTPGEDRPGAYDLVVSALAPYKRLELVLDAYRGTGRPLRVVGHRPGGGAAARSRPARGRPSSAGSKTTSCASCTAAAAPS